MTTALTITLPSEPVPVEADPVRLAQVFANLLSNAVKYTERSGDICLIAEVPVDTAIVKVRDNGTGAMDYVMAVGAIVCQLRIQKMSENEIGEFLDGLKGLASAARKRRPELALAIQYIERLRCQL